MASSTDHNTHEPTADRRGPILLNPHSNVQSLQQRSSYLRFDIYKDVVPIGVNFVELPERVNHAGEVWVANSCSGARNKWS